jgi:hypothetical protein
MPVLFVGGSKCCPHFVDGQSAVEVVNVKTPPCGRARRGENVTKLVFMDGSPAAGGFRRASALLSHVKSSRSLKTEDEVKEALGQLTTYFGYNSFRVGQVRGGAVEAAADARRRAAAVPLRACEVRREPVRAA